MAKRVSDEPAEAVPAARRRRLLLLMGLAAAAVAAGWFAGPWWVAARASTSLEDRRPEDALDWLDRGERWFGTHAETAALRVRALRKAGRAAEFAETLSAAQEAGVDAERLRREVVFAKASGGGFAEVVGELPALLEDPRGDEREILESFANGAVANYRIEEAEPLIEAWRSRFPGDPRADLLAGRVEEHKGQWDAAVALYEAALENEPGYGPAAYNLARVKLNRKKPEEALSAYETAAAWPGCELPAAAGRAHCLRLLGRPNEARDALAMLKDADPAEAERQFRRVGQTALAARTAYLAELGRIELEAGNPAAAADLLGRAVEANPRDQTLRYLLSRALTADGRAEEAGPHLDFYKEASAATGRLDGLMERLRADPKDADLRAEIGAIFLKYLSEPQGRVWLKSALAYDPDNEAAQDTLRGAGG